MTLNDNDLKRLKEHVRKCEGIVVAMPDGRHIPIQAILDRLEAAEKL